ncbi:MAG: hypothetical protein KDI30_12820 [Pseudomonadales bacterium]|nr:hypothetical protein [Pseudomonadales bacterium]
MNDTITENTESTASQPAVKPSSTLKTFFIILCSVLLSVLIVFASLKYFLFPDAFRPVNLSEKEQQQLEQKIDRLDNFSTHTKLQPERYSEDNAERSIKFSERELNALLAKNTDLADKLAIDLSDNLASIKLLVPVDPDFPVIGGKTLKVSGGVALSYSNGKPLVALRGISIWGVPLPNAWLGNLKNVDLVEMYGNDPGFWRSFSEGVENIVIKEGSVLIELKE